MQPMDDAQRYTRSLELAIEALDMLKAGSPRLAVQCALVIKEYRDEMTTPDLIKEVDYAISSLRVAFTLARWGLA